MLHRGYLEWNEVGVMWELQELYGQCESSGVVWVNNEKRRDEAGEWVCMDTNKLTKKQGGRVCLELGIIEGKSEVVVVRVFLLLRHGAV